MGTSVIDEKLFNKQVDFFLEEHHVLKGEWLNGNNGDIYAHLDYMLYEKFGITFGFIDNKETKPIIYFGDGTSKIFNESTIPRQAYYNLVSGVIKTTVELFKNIEE